MTRRVIRWLYRGKDEMNEFQATAVIVALFALRCIVPIVLMFAIGYGMKKLVRHWENEEARPVEPRVAIPLPVAARATAETPKKSLPCWVLNNCDEAKRNACPAYASPSLACWVARLRADGQLPAKCSGCALYTGAPSFAAGD